VKQSHNKQSNELLWTANHFILIWQVDHLCQQDLSILQFVVLNSVFCDGCVLYLEIMFKVCKVKHICLKCYGNLLKFEKETRNAWQSLAYSPFGATSVAPKQVVAN